VPAEGKTMNFLHRKTTKAKEASPATFMPVRTFGPEIPALFFVVLDLISLLVGFETAYLLAPGLKHVLLVGDWLPATWVALLSPEVAGEFRPIQEAVWVLLVMTPAMLLTIQAMGGYRPLGEQSRTRIVLSATVAPIVSLSMITLILFTLKSPSWSRLFIFLFTAISAVELGAYRLLLRWYRARRIASGFYAKNVVFIGPRDAMSWLPAHVVRHTSPGDYVLLGYMSAPPGISHGAVFETESAECELPCLGDVGALSALLVHSPVHEVIAIQSGRSAWLREVVDTCEYFRITLRIVPEDLVFGRLRDLELLYHSAPLRLPEIVLRPKHLDSTALFIKRVIDILVSGVGLLVLSPLFLLIAAAIKLTTPGLPVFYRWQVVGFNGRRFTGYKFSTMGSDADSRKLELASRNEMQGPVFKIRNDPRVTPLGKYLRKFSLNELPQLWSVLNGDMSLVGPRPAFPHELERYEIWHKRKLCVRPGITCLWQVRGRNKISRFDDWVKMDLEYIDNWSLWLDCKILVRTVIVVIKGTGS
jgi:exopolysaccharide biosynthesis polyprenyl glycosylphosphotransferase